MSALSSDKTVTHRFKKVDCMLLNNAKDFAEEFKRDNKKLDVSDLFTAHEMI